MKQTWQDYERAAGFLKMNKFYLWVISESSEKTTSQIIGKIVACDFKVSHSAKTTSNSQISVLPLSIESKFDLTETRNVIVKALEQLPVVFVILTEQTGSAWNLPPPIKKEEPILIKATGAKPTEGLKIGVIRRGGSPEPSVSSPSVPPITASILEALNKVVKASCSLSDVFFDGVTKEERVLLSESLDKLIEGGFRVEGK